MHAARGRRQRQRLTCSSRGIADPYLVEFVWLDIHIHSFARRLDHASAIGRCPVGERRGDGIPVYELGGSDGLDGRFCGLWGTAAHYTDGADGSHHLAKVRVASSHLVIRSTNAPRSAALSGPLSSVYRLLGGIPFSLCCCGVPVHSGHVGSGWCVPVPGLAPDSWRHWFR